MTKTNRQRNNTEQDWDLAWQELEDELLKQGLIDVESGEALEQDLIYTGDSISAKRLG